MFSGFTEDAVGVVAEAQRIAEGLGVGFVGTEHILLALVTPRRGLAAEVLSSMGFTDENLRAQLATVLAVAETPAPPDAPYPGPFVGLGRQLLEMPFAPRAKEVLELSVREALTLGSGSIETEHILLGVVREPESVAMRVLLAVDAELPRSDDERFDRDLALEIRNDVIRRLSAAPGH